MPEFRDGTRIPISFSREIERHEAKLIEAIRAHLWQLIETVDIFGSGNKGPRTIRLRVRGIKEFRFRFASGEAQEAGGELPDGDGDELVKEGGDQAGTEPGDKDYDEIDFDREQLQDLIFESWNLPPPKPKELGPLTHEKELHLRGLRRKGALSLLAKRYAVKERLRRILGQNNADIARAPFHENDLRYFRFEKEEEGTKAVHYCLRDVSGSMAEEKQRLCRVLFGYQCAFLDRRFPETERFYIVHTTEAEFEKETEFFTRTSSGGTQMSSALKLMLDDIRVNHPPEEWNVYAMYASDGENQQDDNRLCLEILEEILQFARQFVYIETASNPSPLMRDLQKFADRPNFISANISERDPNEVKPVLDRIMSREVRDDS